LLQSLQQGLPLKGGINRQSFEICPLKTQVGKHGPLMLVKMQARPGFPVKNARTFLFQAADFADRLQVGTQLGDQLGSCMFQIASLFKDKGRPGFPERPSHRLTAIAVVTFYLFSALALFRRRPLDIVSRSRLETLVDDNETLDHLLSTVEQEHSKSEFDSRGCLAQKCCSRSFSNARD
jgi:hypothetical protein